MRGLGEFPQKGGMKYRPSGFTIAYMMSQIALVSADINFYFDCSIWIGY